MNNLSITERKYTLDHAVSWLWTTVFVAGNIILPQLCHLVPQGGLTWLPIYFFTLIAAYGFGWQVGLITALASPLINSALFGMPATAILPIIMFKSTLLAGFASFAGSKLQRMPLFLCLVLVVLAYQIVGTCFERLFVDSWAVAFTDFRTGFPGMIVQVLGGYVVLKLMHR